MLIAATALLCCAVWMCGVGCVGWGGCRRYVHLQSDALYSLTFPAHMEGVQLSRLSFAAYERERWVEYDIPCYPAVEGANRCHPLALTLSLTSSTPTAPGSAPSSTVIPSCHCLMSPCDAAPTIQPGHPHQSSANGRPPTDQRKGAYVHSPEGCATPPLPPLSPPRSELHWTMPTPIVTFSDSMAFPLLSEEDLEDILDLSSEYSTPLSSSSSGW